MPAALLKIFGAKVQVAELAQTFGPYAGKFIQQLRQRLALDLAHVPQTIERRKRPRLTELQQELRARDPVGAFSVNQMADDPEDGPGVLTFVAVRPGFGQIAEKGVERSGGAREERDGAGQVVFHGALQPHNERLAVAHSLIPLARECSGQHGLLARPAGSALSNNPNG